MTTKINDRLVFESNTHPFPSFIVDDLFLKQVSGNATLKILIVIIRFTVGFHADKSSLGNSQLSRYTGMNKVNVSRTLLKLKDELKIIDYENSNDGKEIRNIKILLPERYYNEYHSEEVSNAIKVLKKIGIKLPEDQLRKLELKNLINRTGETVSPVKSEKFNHKIEWTSFLNYAIKNFTKSTSEIFSTAEVKYKEDDFLFTIKIQKISDRNKELISKYFIDKFQFLKINIEEIE